MDASTKGPAQERGTPFQLASMLANDFHIIAHHDAALAAHAEADRCPIIQFDVDSDAKVGHHDPVATCRFGGPFAYRTGCGAAFLGQFCLTACSVQDKTPLHVRPNPERDVLRMNRRTWR